MCPTFASMAFVSVFFLLALILLLLSRAPVPSPAQKTSSRTGSIITAQITFPSLTHAKERA